MLHSIATSEQGNASRAAVIQLAANWPDENTRSLLLQVAKRSSNRTSASAITQLAHKWRDAETKAFIERIAMREENSLAVNAAKRVLQHFARFRITMSQET